MGTYSFPLNLQHNEAPNMHLYERNMQENILAILRNLLLFSIMCRPITKELLPDREQQLTLLSTPFINDFFFIRRQNIVPMDSVLQNIGVLLVTGPPYIKGKNPITYQQKYL